MSARPPLSARELAVNGDDIMSALSIAPGPRVGAVLDALLERVLDDPALNEPDLLLALARELAPSLP
jgi:tRNA nucleotidyltransferase (CCA-adding enzyme)